jgi:hypothetical protein
MLNAHSSILGDIATLLEGTDFGLDLCSMLDANASRLSLVRAPLTTAQLDLRPMFLANSSRLGLIVTPLGGALITVFEFGTMTDTDTT